MNVEEKIVDIIAELSLVKREEIKSKDRLREDLGLDSVASMELLSALSEELDLDIEMEETLQITTVEAVIDLARERLRENAS